MSGPVQIHPEVVPESCNSFMLGERDRSSAILIKLYIDEVPMKSKFRRWFVTVTSSLGNG